METFGIFREVRKTESIQKKTNTMDRNELEKKMQRIKDFRMKLDYNVKAGTKGFQKKENTASKAMKVRFLPENHKLIADHCKAMGITFSEFLREAAKKHLMSESEKLQREKTREMA